MEVDIVFFTNFAKVKKQRTVVEMIVKIVSIFAKIDSHVKGEGDCLDFIVN